MSSLKKILGFVWLLLGPALIFFLLFGAITYIDSSGTRDINNPVIWVIILLIFIPIALGLTLFGWYALKGEYEKLPEDSTEF